MDSRRFDEIMRALATDASRRRVLRSLAAGAAGGLLWRGRVPGVVAQASATPGLATCVEDGDCATADADPCTGSRCDNGTCAVFIVDCAPGFTCCGDGTCCPDATQCRSDVDCAVNDGGPCTGARCDNGRCVVSTVDCVPGFVCCGGGCIEACGASQTLNANCRCIYPVPQDRATSEAGPAGSSGGNEAAGDGTSEDVTTPPVRLPNTGSGPSTTALRNGWGELCALLGTAVALIARRVHQAPNIDDRSLDAVREAGGDYCAGTSVSRHRRRPRQPTSAHIRAAP